MAETVSEMNRRDIAASLDGDAEAYRQLVRRYEGQVAGQMWRFTRDVAVLEEREGDVVHFIQ